MDTGTTGALRRIGWSRSRARLPDHFFSDDHLAGWRHRTRGNRLVVLIAAHNEEKSIGATLRSLADQTRLPDDVIVVADRCTDRTAEIAFRFGAAVLETVDNRHRKAGGLNQVLAALLAGMEETDFVLMMDADTVLSHDFLFAAEARLNIRDGSRSDIGAVGAVFLSHDDPGNVIQHFQRNEYLRYAHDLQRRKGRAEVISGTAGLFRVAVLREVIAHRGEGLPQAAYVYDNSSWTEDNELTTAVKHLGYRCASPTECTVRTELMPTLATLYYQRLRWQRGALDTLRRYGITRMTIPYIIRQLLIHVGIFFFPFFFAVLAIAVHQTGQFPWSWPWFFFSSIVVVERVWTVRRGGWRAILLAALIVPEILYDLFLHIVFVRALVDSITRSGGNWDHAEASRHRPPGRVKRVMRAVAQVAIPIGFVVAAVAAAFVTSLAGIQWIVVGVIVGGGIAHAALRATFLDPMAFWYGSSEIPQERASPERAPVAVPVPDRPWQQVVEPVPGGPWRQVA